MRKRYKVNRGEMNIKILALGSIIFALSACSQPVLDNQLEDPNRQVVIPENALDPGPTSAVGPGVTMSARSSALSKVLLSNGFEINPICDTPCFTYESTSLRMAANIQGDDEFVIHVFKDSNGVLNMQVPYLLITQAFSQEISNWIDEHLEASLQGDQDGDVGEYNIWIRVYEDKGIIRITPRDGS